MAALEEGVTRHILLQLKTQPAADRNGAISLSLTRDGPLQRYVIIMAQTQWSHYHTDTLRRVGQFRKKTGSKEQP